MGHCLLKMWILASSLAVLPLFPPGAVASSAGCCHPLSAWLTRELSKEGFHRDLVTCLQVPWSAELTDCRLLIVERLPPGLYTDPYQLARLHGNQHRVVGDVDIEAMAYNSDWMEVLTWAELNATEGAESGQVTPQTTLPVHARYHRADETERLAAVYMAAPQVYLGCDWAVDVGCPCAGIALPCRPAGPALCSYQPVPLDNSPTAVMAVPIGDLRDLELVLVGTTVAVTAGTVLLLLVITNRRLDCRPP